MFFLAIPTLSLRSLVFCFHHLFLDTRRLGLFVSVSLFPRHSRRRFKLFTASSILPSLPHIRRIMMVTNPPSFVLMPDFDVVLTYLLPTPSISHSSELST